MGLGQTQAPGGPWVLLGCSEPGKVPGLRPPCWWVRTEKPDVWAFSTLGVGQRERSCQWHWEGRQRPYFLITNQTLVTVI